MKKITLLLGLIAVCSFNLLAFDEKVLCNFDDVNPGDGVPYSGAVHELVDNDLADDDNDSDKCGQYYGEEGTNPNSGLVQRVWFANTAIPIESVTIPTSGNYYIHILVNAQTFSDIAIALQCDETNTKVIRPLVGYDDEFADYWQDMVFQITPTYAGQTVDTLNFYGDMKWNSGGEFVTGEFFPLFFDEIIINDSPLSRFSDVQIPDTMSATISNMEDGELEWASMFGAVPTVVDNSDTTGINTSSKCLQLADAEETDYALVDYATTDFVLPKRDCYLHIMTKSIVSPILSVRMMPDNKTDIFPMDSLNPDDTWQDLVFDISAVKTSTPIDGIRFMLDYFGDNLNMTDSLIYIDEVVFSTDSMPRTEPTPITETAIGESKATAISIYPTLADNQLTIMGGNVLSVDLISLSGVCVSQQLVIDNTIDVSALKSGVYFVRGRNAVGKSILSQKFIKN